MKLTNSIFSAIHIVLFSLLITLSTFASADPTLVFGHKNPDSDSIFSAISMAHLKTAQGSPSQAVAQGLPSPETQFALSYFGLQAPPVINKVAGHKVFLVDHNNYTQSPDDLKEAEIVGIVDHHNLGGIVTSNPLYVLIEPVGCANSIIWQLYKRAGIPIPPAIAGGMMSAILSDTLVFKSPTTTDLDRAAVKDLASISKVKDYQKYAEKMFLAGEADLKTATAAELIQRDFKNFNFNGNKVGIGQLEVYSFSLLKDRKGELLAEMKKLQAEQGYQDIVFMLTDIKSEGSELLVVGKNEGEISAAFNTSLSNQSVWIPGLMSRKKQVVPALSKVFN